MRIAFVLSLILLSLNAVAKTSGTFVFNSENTEAKLMLFEVMSQGELSKFYDKMQRPETVEKNTRSKNFKLSNNLFLIQCQKTNSNFAQNTTCHFIIRKGKENENFYSELFNSNDKKYAFIKISSVFSSELTGLFPTETVSGDIMYALQLPNYINLDVNGSLKGDTTLGFYFN